MKVGEFLKGGYKRPLFFDVEKGRVLKVEKVLREVIRLLPNVVRVKEFLQGGYKRPLSFDVEKGRVLKVEKVIRSLPNVVRVKEFLQGGYKRPLFFDVEKGRVLKVKEQTESRERDLEKECERIYGMWKRGETLGESKWGKKTQTLLDNLKLRMERREKEFMELFGK